MAEKNEPIRIGDANDNTYSFSPRQLLESVVAEIDSGEIEPDNCLVIMGIDEPECDTVVCRKAQLHDNMAITLMEQLKFLLMATRFSK